MFGIRKKLREDDFDDDEDDLSEEDEPAKPKGKFGFKQVTAMQGVDYSQLGEKRKKQSLLHKESLVNVDEHKLDKLEKQRHQTDLLQDIKDKKDKPLGLLAVHVKKGTFYDLDPTSDHERSDLSVYIRIYTTRQLKTTCCYDNVYPPAELVFDDIRHFTLMPSDEKNDPRNSIRIEVAAFDPDHPRKHRFLAAKEIHMYDIIKNLYLVEKYEMVRIQTLIAVIEVEMCFSYGELGYGYTNQFDNKRQSTKDILSHSMFYRSEPPAKRRESGKREIMTATHIGHPSFIDFDRKVDIGSAPHEFAEEISLYDWQMEDAPTLLINKMARHMKILKRELHMQRNRRERLAFLRRLILCEMPSVNDTVKEVVDLPKNFRLIHRRAPSSSATNPYEAFEDEEFDPSLISDELIGQQAAVLGLAPGINVRRSPREMPEQEEEEEVKEEGGFLSGLLGTMRRFSFRPPEAHAEEPSFRLPVMNTALTIQEEDEDEEDLPTVAMRPLYEESSDNFLSVPQQGGGGVGGAITGFFRRLSTSINPFAPPAPEDAPRPGAPHDSKASLGQSKGSLQSRSSLQSRGSLEQSRASLRQSRAELRSQMPGIRVSPTSGSPAIPGLRNRRNSITPSLAGGASRRGSILSEGRRGSIMSEGSRRGSMFSDGRRGSLMSEGSRRGSLLERPVPGRERRGSILESLASALGVEGKPPPEAPRLMLQPSTPESSPEQSEAESSTSGEETDSSGEEEGEGEEGEEA